MKLPFDSTPREFMRSLLRTHDRLSRRGLLEVGSLGMAGLSLSRMLEGQAFASESSLAAPAIDSCILLFLNGGPSHIDMWDPKPDAAAEVRGEFSPIATSVPGYRVTDQIPRLAQQMHLATVVRSMHHSVNNAHAAAVYCALTGHDRGEIGGGTRSTDYPSPGSVTSLLRPVPSGCVPHVCLPYVTKEGAGGPPQPGFFGGFLGHSHDPFFVLKDPNDPEFAVPELSLPGGMSESRFERRRHLFSGLDDSTGSHDSGEMTRFQERALELLTSEQTQSAFRLDRETDALRDAYGRNIYGQSVLLARRLIEAGTRLVTVSWAPDANATWDTHGGNFEKLRSTLLPQFDSACASLIEDLNLRGMLDRTLVAVMGDFGRTPKINANNAGRDHWNFCYSLMLIGGGFGKGLIYGRSDEIGAFPAADPLKPSDIMATIYNQFGIPPETELHDQFGRPYRLAPNDGHVIAGLLG